MEEIRVNIDNISKIEIHVKKECTIYKWREHRKATIFTNEQKEGFHNHWGEHVDGCLNLYKEDEKIYYFPFIKMFMAGGQNEYRFFNSEDELREFLNRKEFKKINWIEL